MPQIEVEVVKAQREGDVIYLEILWQGWRLSRSVTASEVSIPQALAQWLLAQVRPDRASDETVRRKLIIDFHQETDPETGRIYPAFDGVTVQKLDEDTAIEAIAALPGWATWDGDQAEAWIETNVTNLASSKVAFKAMARMIIAERDVIKKLVERVGL